MPGFGSVVNKIQERTSFERKMNRYFLIVLFLLANILTVYAVKGNEIERTVALLSNKDASVTDRIIANNEGRNQQLFEGDIVLTDHDDVDTSNFDDVDGPLEYTVKRNAQWARKGLWLTKEVPYVIHSDLGDYKRNINAAIEQFTLHTCVRWIPYTNQRNWVKFVKKNGCYSSVGRKYWLTGPQEVSLGSGCNHQGTIMHEMLHAIGFWHEQSRPDRNQHVEVMWENIYKGKEHNFNKYKRTDIDVLNTNYDFDSIMHYGKYAFSKNNKPTLLSIKDPERELGQQNGFSQLDIFKVNALYDCKKNSSTGWSSWTSWSDCTDGCYRVRQRFCTSIDRKTFCPGADEHGIEMDLVDCTQEECKKPVDGHWGRWSAWTTCSKSCGTGKQTRTRLCNDPPPKFSGKSCAGSNTTEQSCKVLTCGLGPDGCDFEDNVCHWHQPTSYEENSFRWERYKGATPSSNTGPSEDHTTKNGYYVFAEASSPVSEGQSANLVSKKFSPTNIRCVTFYYHMYGEGMGTLNVFINDTSTGDMKLIFTKTGNQGDEWKKGNATIASPEKYKVMFQAVRGKTFESDIAIDDIIFYETSCETATTQPPVVTTQPPVVTTHPPVVTTQPPVVTTQPPVVTTQPPVVTIKPPVVTTKRPVVTTKRPVITTRATTKKPWTPPPTKVPTCRDDNVNCKNWAYRGECTRNPRYMNIYCKKSCNRCHSSCLDYNNNCQYWASIGECWRNRLYMHANCRKSCRLCTTGHCVDRSPSSWCRTYQYYCRYTQYYQFRQNCRRTCRLC